MTFVVELRNAEDQCREFGYAGPIRAAGAETRGVLAGLRGGTANLRPPGKLKLTLETQPILALHRYHQAPQFPNSLKSLGLLDIGVVIFFSTCMTMLHGINCENTR